MRARGCFLLAVCALVASLTAGAWAVQPLYRVDRDVVFLPLDGVALDAHTGHLRWRFPRFQGETQTDGRGMLIVSWATVIQPKLHRRVFRFCRLRTSDGARLWCRDAVNVLQWTLDNDSAAWYVHTPGRLEVRHTSDGQSDRGCGLPDDRELTLMPLPERGAMLLRRRHGQTSEALTVRPGAATLEAETVPPGLYPFHGNGHGLLLYARQKSEYFLAAPFKLLLHEAGRGAEAKSAFPAASLDGHGFVFTGWQGTVPVLHGGTYAGALWQAPRGSGHAELAIAGDRALMLDAGTLRGWRLDTGRLAFALPVDRGFDRLTSGGGAVVLQSDTAIAL